MPKIHISRTSLIILIQIILLIFLAFSLWLQKRQAAESTVSPESAADGSIKKEPIRWVDFTIPANIMEKAFRLDIHSCQEEVHLNWIELLAWLGAKYGGDFSLFRQKDLDGLAESLKQGLPMEALTKDLKYYPYYREAYQAVLGGMVGYFRQEAAAFEGNKAASEGDTESPEKIWQTKYGLKAFSPIAKGFPYTDYDDFGVSRNYGYKRQHLGHDMMGQVGTPVIAVESGYVEALGWNRYGGWRIGIRSFDKKRYYYYAHLRKNYPYQGGLDVGSTVTAGDVIGYLGRTGYSDTENTNNIDTPHLHFGMQLIFDESQKEGNNEIWIDCYELIKFLHMNQSEVKKVEGTKEWNRVYRMDEEISGDPVNPPRP